MFAIYARFHAADNIGTDPNVKDKNGNTLLHRAAEQGNLGLLTTMLDAGTDPNAKNCVNALKLSQTDRFSAYSKTDRITEY